MVFDIKKRNVTLHLPLAAHITKNASPVLLYSHRCKRLLSFSLEKCGGLFQDPTPCRSLTLRVISCRVSKVLTGITACLK